MQYPVIHRSIGHDLTLAYTETYIGRSTSPPDANEVSPAVEPPLVTEEPPAVEAPLATEVPRDLEAALDLEQGTGGIVDVLNECCMALSAWLCCSGIDLGTVWRGLAFLFVLIVFLCLFFVVPWVRNK